MDTNLAHIKIKDNINNYLNKHNCKDYIIDIDDSLLLQKLYLLFECQLIDEESINPDYLNGIGIYYYNNKDLNSAIKYYAMAINYNCHDAVCNLGILYYKELKDFKSAEECFLAAIKNDHTRSIFEYASILKLSGNYQKSIEYYLKAAEKGHIPSINSLGYYYEYNLQEYNLAEFCYTMAANYDYLPAIHNLARIYRKKDDIEQCVKYYKMAIDKGHIQSMYEYANICGFLGDNDGYVEFHKMASNKGYLPSMNLLGSYYENLNPSKLYNAEKYYLKASQYGYSPSMYNLGKLYEIFDLSLSKKYYLMGAENDNKNCINEINRLLHQNFDHIFAVRACLYLDSINLDRLYQIVSIVLDFEDIKINESKCAICNNIKKCYVANTKAICAVCYIEKLNY